MDIKAFIALIVALVGGAFVAAQALNSMTNRLASVEARMENQATKADLANLKHDITTGVNARIRASLLNAWVECQSPVSKLQTTFRCRIAAVSE